MKTLFSNLTIAALAAASALTSGYAFASDKFVMRYRDANLTLAPGESGFVVAPCKAGYVAVGGGMTGYAPSIRLENSAPSFDGNGRSGWLVDVSNRTNETVTAFVSVTAICTKGTYTIEQAN
jgi:hypothetical protein